MAHFFYNYHCCFLIQYLVDGNHTTHFHQGFDYFSSFYRHFLGKYSNRDSFRYHYLVNDRFCWSRESMTCLIFAGVSLSVSVSSSAPSRFPSRQIITSFLSTFSCVSIFPNNLFGLFLFLRGLCCFIFRFNYRLM